MDEPEGVPEFMFYLLDQPPLQDGPIGGQAVKLLLQPGKGDNRHVPIQLGLTKDKGQDRNKEVRGGDADHLRGIRGEFVQHLLQDLGGMILFTRWIIGVLRLDPASGNLCGGPKFFPYVFLHFPETYYFSRISDEVDIDIIIFLHIP